jgi:photosystem II stability/assembly factor-like uncharacterized protein
MSFPHRAQAGLLQFLLAVAVPWLAALNAKAHPYASGVTNVAGRINFILNENAGDVKILFDNGTVTNDLGALSRGQQPFNLSPHTNFSIVVSNAGSGVFAQTSVDSNALVSFLGPRGVAVNRNPANSYFGRIYVDNANPGAVGGRTVGRGLYLLNADQSDAVGQGTNARTAGIALSTAPNGTTYSPYKINVGPDGQVYIEDAMTNTCTLWMTDPNVTVATQVLNDIGLLQCTNINNAGVPNAVHGRGISKPVVRGSLAAGNLAVYEIDPDWPPSNSILRYSIGSGPLPWNHAPDAVLANTGLGGFLIIADLEFSGTNFYSSGDRINDGDTYGSVKVFDATGTIEIWNSYSQSLNPPHDPFLMTRAIAISPDGQYLATMRGDSLNCIVHLTNGIPDLTTVFTNVITAVNTGYAVGWDAADNVYIVSGGFDLLRVFSLGLTTTAITSNDATGTNGTFRLIIGPSPPTILAQPQSVSTVVGAATSFTVSASGAGPLGYQWQFNGANLNDGAGIAGSHTNVLNLSSLAFSEAGGYAVIVSNGGGSVTSAVATLTVLTDSVPLWVQLPNTPGPGNIRHDDIYFTDPTNGWSSQDNNIYRTTNGGATWTTNLVLPGTHFRSIAFATPLIGFAGNLGVGSYDGGVTDTNVLYRSIDGGMTWSNVPGFAEAGMKGLCVVDVLDSQHIYGAGRVRGPAFFIKSSDGGNTWSILNLTAAGVMNAIMDVYFRDVNNGWVVGMDTNAYSSSCSPPYYGRIARTTDGGNTWTPVVTTPVSCSYFWKMSWPSTNVGYCSLQQNASFNNIVFYKTTDGGNTWVSNAIPLSSVGLTTSQFYLQGIGFVSTNEGWIGGASGIPVLNSFLHTTDGGVTWTPAGYSDTSFMNRFRFLSPTLGYASGGNLHIYSAPLVITNQPQSQVVIGGSNVTLAVGAAGTGPISYQWQENGTNQPGATASTLTLPAITRIDSGTYSVTVTNNLSNLQSSNAVIRVIVAERLGQPVLLPGGQLQLLFGDADGGALLTANDLATFDVLASTNLVDWTVLTNALSLTNGYVLFQDSSTNYPARFYRVREH